MIVELAPDNLSKVMGLYRSSEFRFPLISAVLEGKQRGQVFADDENNPQSAIVINNFGFMFYVGRTNPDFNVSLSELFESTGRIKRSYLLWYTPPATWQEKLSNLGQERARVRERIRFEFRGDRTRYLNEAIVSPPGFEVRNLEGELIPQTKKLGVNIEGFWSSAEDLEKNGVSFCIVKGDEVVSVCYAAAISEGLAEVDVATDETFRGRGLAEIVSRHFIRECLIREITPTWDCFAYNTGSLRLATRLGFRELVRYPFYSFNVPLSADGEPG